MLSLNEHDTPTAPARKRGRPPASKSAVLRDDRRLGLNHFAFLRACVQGISTRWSWRRYMEVAEPWVASDERAIEHRRKTLLQSILASARDLDRSAELAAAAHAVAVAQARAAGATAPVPRHGERLDRYVAILEDLVGAPPTAETELPTLDEFCAAEGVDAGDWSESDLMEMYRERYGLGGEPDEPSVNAQAFAEESPSAAEDSERVLMRVRAINVLSSRLAESPQPQDPLALWLDAKLADRITTGTGAETLSHLAGVIAARGRGWWRPVRGLGSVRADQVTGWIIDHQIALAYVLPERLLPGEAASAAPRLRAVADTPSYLAPRPSSGSSAMSLVTAVEGSYELATTARFGLVPLEALAVPDSLGGRDGAFRSHMPNTLGAGDDLDAIRRWLSRHQEHHHSYRSYRKEAERFYLWCVLERKKALSSIDAIDCQAYRAFLADLPDHWIGQPVGEARLRDAAHSTWKPFRGQLKPSSQRQALVVVQILLHGLHTAGYTVANPMAAVMKHFSLPASAVDLTRSFTTQERRYLAVHTAGITDGPVRRRAQAALELLLSTGLRRQEVASATWGAFERVVIGLDRAAGSEPFAEVSAEPSATWMLTVVGKRGKKRTLPVPRRVVGLLRAHAIDLEPTLAHATEEARAAWMPAADTALLRSFGSFGEDAAGASSARGAPLGDSGTYVMLKRIFESAAKRAEKEQSSLAAERRDIPMRSSNAAGRADAVQAGAVAPDRDVQAWERLDEGSGQGDLVDARRLRAMSTHWLRHTFGRTAGAAGVPLDVLSQAFGHESVDTTSIYMTVERDRLAREMARVEVLLAQSA